MRILLLMQFNHAVRNHTVVDVDKSRENIASEFCYRSIVVGGSTYQADGLN